MSLHADLEWELRTSGSDNNGGAFRDADPGTSVDYSQQDSAQLAPSDLAMVTGGTTLTSAAGGFTGAMVGNVIHITSGTNFTAGWYEITAYTDTNTIEIDRDATNGSNASSGQGYVGGGVQTPEAIDAIVVAGNTVHVQAGTYTLTGAVGWTAGGADSQVLISGYHSSHGDSPTGDDRPLFSCGAYTWGNTNDYVSTEHLRFSGTGNPTLKLAGYAKHRNLYWENTTASSNRPAAQLQDHYAIVIDCEGTCPNSTGGRALDCYSRKSIVVGCYFHDATYGLYTVDDGSSVAFTIFDTCAADGLNSNSNCHNLTVINCVFYGCDDGLYYHGSGLAVLNCVFEACTTYGINVGSSTSASILLDHNNWRNNGTDVSGCSKGPNATAVDPQFTDAGGGDFSRSGSNLDGQALSITQGVG